ncbi:TOX high mobility group box family member 4-like isoform X1 [Hetaerina americana]|uniref:TOX high mobility group box family member 4-like isoform X1 n=2 Tax=Hetaerina americana TaxID=62018 RepID=UPI003A7F4CED
MEATYTVGSDVDFCRMFDQYLYKRTENLDLSLSIPHSFNSSYMAADQTFHTPSFGDEEFDIPPLHHGGAGDGVSAQQQLSGYAQQPQMGMNCGPPGDTGNYQQPLYLSEHSLAMSSSPGYGSPQQQPPGGYGSLGGTTVGGSPVGMMQHHMQQSMAMPQSMGGMGYSPPHTLHQLQPQQQQPPPPHPMSHQMSHQMASQMQPPMQAMENTTSEDSDDSGFLQQQHHSAMMAGLKRPSPEPAESPTGGMMGKGGAAAAKKAKGTKKKKKRDPNEPQKPVSAYALFFRDTQAAIKGQNPTASFGEVSKIVASMWDALDAEHKNVYKKKTEAAKKEYLKALALYRASLVSKGASESEVLYPGYPPSTSSPSSQQQHVPQPPPPPPPPFYPPPFSSPPSSSSSSSPPSHVATNNSGGQLSPLAKKPNFLHQDQQQAMMLSSMARNSMQQQNAMMPTQYMQQDGMVHPGYHMAPGGGNLLPPASSLAPPQSPSTPSGAMMATNSPPHMHHHQIHHPHQVNNQSTHQDDNGASMGGQMVSGGNAGGMSPSAGQQGNGQQQASAQQQPAPQNNGQQQQPPQGGSGGGMEGGGGVPQSPNACIRVGCPNQAVPNSEWEDEYCSNECVVSHCRDVFSSWVASNQGSAQSYNAVK